MALTEPSQEAVADARQFTEHPRIVDLFEFL